MTTKQERLSRVMVKWYDLVSFTRDLCITLVAWGGMEAEYKPEADPYKQVILTFDGGEPFFTVTVSSDYSIAVLGMVCHDVDDLLTRLPDAIQRRRDYRTWLRAKYALSEYCNGCYYSDEDAQYCGMGRVMEVGFNHKLDNQ